MHARMWLWVTVNFYGVVIVTIYQVDDILVLWSRPLGGHVEVGQTRMNTKG
jgi:hypothetical protein